jgi:rfaE bifunctional protein nucleotidyltransferase chain/domain
MKTAEKILTMPELLDKLESWRDSGKIVFTNGCFDILHLGHIDYLEKAAEKGHKLIVGLNTDTSVQKLKGPQRPLNNEYSRARILAALQFVDAVVLFEEDTPLNLIMSIIPDILVKGDDYVIGNIIGADFVISKGGKVETVALVKGHSTTNLISKIQHNQ